MSKQETIEVDPSELSDEILEDLVDEANISQEEAEEFADEAQLEQMDFDNPNKENAIESIRKKSKSSYSKLQDIYSLLSSKNARPIITEVEPTNSNDVILHIKHSRLKDHSIRFSEGDTRMANLMEYHGVSSPADLENKRLVLDEIKAVEREDTGFHSYSPTYLIPNNVSILGQARYKLFSITQDVRSKTNISVDGDPVSVLLFGSIVYLIAFMLTLLVGSAGNFLLSSGFFIIGNILMMPLLLTIFVGVLAIFYLCMRPVLLVLYKVLRGDFHKEEF